MAALPASNTARFRFHYTTVGENHTVQFRSASSPAVMGILFQQLLTALGASIFVVTVNTVDWAPSGSDIFNPVTTGIEGTSYGVGAGATFNAPWAVTFVGRTSGGRRVRAAIFGMSTIAGNYRFAPGESAQVDAAINVLQGAGSNIVGIDGVVPVWYDYANVQVNDHWVKIIR